MSDTAYPVYQHYGTAAQRAAFTPAPPASGQPIYIWRETDTGDTYLYDTSWHKIASSTPGTGDVVGPGSAVNNDIAVFDTTTGKLIKDGGTTIAALTALIPTTAITQLTSDVTAGPGPGSVAATIANNAVSDAKLRDSAALSVIGRATNSSGDPADITAGSDDTLLTRISSALAWTQLTIGMAAANLWTFAKLQQIATGKVLGRGSASTGNIEELTPTSGIETTSTPGIRQTVAARTRSINFIIDGGGSAITTGVKGDFRFPVAGTITKVSLLGDQSGSIVLDIWKAAFATGTSPTVANTITASAKPTITATVNSEDSTLSGWTTSVSAGDCFRVNVDSITTLTRVAMALDIVVTG